MYRVVVCRKRFLEVFTPNPIELAESLANQTVEIRI